MAISHGTGSKSLFPSARFTEALDLGFDEGGGNADSGEDEKDAEVMELLFWTSPCTLDKPI